MFLKGEIGNHNQNLSRAIDNENTGRLLRLWVDHFSYWSEYLYETNSGEGNKKISSKYTLKSILIDT